MSRFGACQNGRICRGRVVVSAPLGFGARLDSHGWVHVSPELHLYSIQPEIPICIVVRISPKSTKSFLLLRSKTSELCTITAPAAAARPPGTPYLCYYLAAVPIHVVAIIPNVRSPPLEDRLSPSQKCRDKGRRPPVEVLSCRLPPRRGASNIGSSSSTSLQHLKVSHHTPRSQHSEPARSMVQPDLSLRKHHATSGPRTQQTPG